MSKKAIILLSGGLDSSTVLAIAKAEGYECYALTINYHQRHNSELVAARNIANFFKVKDFKIVDLDLSWLKNSALTNKDISIPENPSTGIPVTYVPARNTIFLSLALAWAETLNATDIFIGVNALDYSGYPDCRPEYIESFEKTANLATKAGVLGKKFTIHTPLINMTKAEIISTGIRLGINYELTSSCYDPKKNGNPCAHCDACILRLKGFDEISVKDPLDYN